MTPVQEVVGNSNEAKVTTERYDRAFGFKITPASKDKDGKDVPASKEATVMDKDEAEKLSDAGKFEGSVITVSVDYPANWAGLLAYADKVYKDDEGNVRDTNEVLDEIVKLFKAGASVKVNNRLRAQLTKTDEAGNLTFKEEDAPGGILDLTEEITSGSKRRFLTPEEKTWKSLENLPEAVRKSMYDVYLSSIGKTAGAYPASK